MFDMVVCQAEKRVVCDPQVGGKTSGKSKCASEKAPVPHLT